MMRTRLLVEIAMAAALATVLGFFRLYRLPWGGSVSLKMLPLLYLALLRGPRAGAVTGLMTGLVTLVLDPVILHPIQVLLDYPLPYASIGLAGFFRSTPLWGSVVAVLGRGVCHVLSGVVFFAAYAPPDLNRQVYAFLSKWLGLTLPMLLREGMTPWVYSVLYNGSYLVPELLLALLIIPLLLKRLGTT